MRIVRLTVGIASGKTTFSSMFKYTHIPVVDADVIARDMLKKGTGGYQKVVAAFGPDISLQSGIALKTIFLDRYTSCGSLLVLEILKLWIKRYKVIALDIPLLFEAKMDKWTKPIVVVRVDPETQLRRPMEKDNSTEEDARNRINAQMPLNSKRTLADIVIDDTRSLHDLQERFRVALLQNKRPSTWTECWLSRDRALSALLLGVIIGFLAGEKIFINL